MTTGRMEAFTDGVIAIIITVMVLDLKVPAGHDWTALAEAAPVFLAYVLSYINVGVYWANHHHLLHAVERVDGRALWCNLALLFFLSLVPFVIRWTNESGLVALPIAAYGIVLGCAAISYVFLQQALIACNGTNSQLARAVGGDWKGTSSLVLYATATIAAFVLPWLSLLIYVGIAALWLIPDRRIEQNP